MASTSFFKSSGTSATLSASFASSVESVTASAATAASSASAAATSETNAASSAASALSYKNDSFTNKQNAAASQQSATASENAAATSAATATTQAQSATASASTATTAVTTTNNVVADATKLALNAANSQFTLSDSSTTGFSALHYQTLTAANATSTAADAVSTAADAVSTAADVVTTTADKASALASKNSATTSASTATTQATNSANSATASANSATSSAASSTTATTQAALATTNGAAQVALATTQANNAASSATAAASSATASASSATASANSAAAAASALDSFDDRYLGSKTSNPTVDNDGNALVTGALYFNSGANEMRVYDGSSWIAASSAGTASLILYEYTATSNQTTFSGSDDNSATLSYTTNNLQVVMNGVILDPSDFTATNGTSVVLASGAATGDLLNIYAFKSFTVSDTVSASSGGTFAADVNVTGNLDVDGTTSLDGLTVDGDVTLNDGSPNLRLQDTDVNRYVDILYGTRVATIRNTMATGEDMDTVEPSMVFSFKDDSETRTAMTIDHDGQVGIGTSSPSRLLTLDNSSNDGVAAQFQNEEVALQMAIDGGGTNTYTNSAHSVTMTSTRVDSGDLPKLRLAGQGGLDLAVDANNVRMSIDSSGNWSYSKVGFQVDGRNSNAANNASMFYGGIFLSIASWQDTPMLLNRMGNNGTIISFRQAANTVGTISVTGSNTAYNTSSDYRLKTNVSYDWDATTRLKQLKPARFEWIADGDDAVPVDGFLAHEVSSIIPEAITGEKDAVDDDGNAVMQGIDQSKLVPLLCKTILELEARITALEAK